MPAWGAFLTGATVLTVLVVLGAHFSANTLDRFDTSAETAVSNSGDGSTRHEPIERPEQRSANRSQQRTDESARGGERAKRAQPERTGRPQADGTGSARPSGEPTDTAQTELTTGVLFANAVVTQGSVLVVLTVAAWYFSIPHEAFGLSVEYVTATGGPSTETGLTVGLGVAFGLALWIGNELSTRLADAVGAAYDESVRELLAPDSLRGWAGLLGVVLPVVALSEELLFRGALVGVAAAGTGLSPWLFASISSLAFALGHGAQGRVGIVVTGALGFVLAAGYVLSASLLLVVVAHYVINAMEFLVHET